MGLPVVLFDMMKPEPIGQSPRRQRSRFRTRSLGGDIREAASADNGGLARSMENVDFAFP